MNQVSLRCTAASRLALNILASLVVSIAVGSCTFAGGSPGDTADDSALTSQNQGLEQLSAYRATYRVEFEAQRAGEAVHWGELYTLSVLRDPLTRAMTAEWTGENGIAAGSVPVFAAERGDVLYWRNLPSDNCMAAFVSALAADAGGLGATLPELADRLPLISDLGRAGKVESILGVSAVPYTFDESALGAAGEAEAQGQIWLAADGNYIVQYHLEMTVSPADSGLGDRTYTVDYSLEPIEASLDAVLPQDCRLPLPEVGVTADASNVIDLPGYLQFETNATVEDAAAFYEKAIAQAGMDLVQRPSVSESRARLEFTAQGQTIEIQIRGGVPTIVSLIGHRLGVAPASDAAGQALQTPAEASQVQSTASIPAPAVRVVEALSLLLALDGEPAALSSYHLELQHQAPTWDAASGAVRSQASSLVADVQGTAVHFADRTSSSGGALSVTEAYVIEGKEYVVQNGVPVLGSGMASLAWTLWPLDPTSIISAGATGAILTGTELVDGRPSEVYSLSGTGLPQASFGGMGIPVTASEGQLWVDQSTGALLKAVLDYEADVKDGSGTIRGQGTGHMEITVTGIGVVSVALPSP